jgi:hypothetical protein
MVERQILSGSASNTLAAEHLNQLSAPLVPAALDVAPHVLGARLGH